MEGSSGRSKANAGNDWSKEASKESSSKEVCRAILLLVMPLTWTVQASQIYLIHVLQSQLSMMARAHSVEVSLSQTEWVWNLN